MAAPDPDQESAADPPPKGSARGATATTPDASAARTSSDRRRLVRRFGHKTAGGSPGPSARRVTSWSTLAREVPPLNTPKVNFCPASTFSSVSLETRAPSRRSTSAAPGSATLDEIESGFRYNDAVLRHLTVGMKKAETGASPMMKVVEREEAKKVSAEPAAAVAAAAA